MFPDKHHRYRFRRQVAIDAGEFLAQHLRSPEGLPEGPLREYVVTATRFFLTALTPTQLERLRASGVPEIDPTTDAWVERLFPLHPQLPLFSELTAK